ncbi:DUF4221 family protein [Algoriphagus formosus]|jgi:hypothetical protein|uniref:DUF4221 domain-containing protein n=1 Tax=Algoriphagus formosus TaxID=2007308 RepID=A0A4R5VFM5_9BACT|nr:DUF4221 family protein [Algoriphagus aquimaris]TDK51101.1 DUF4221 domain-containing protein [Algoriphagus aquimaris]
MKAILIEIKKIVILTFLATSCTEDRSENSNSANLLKRMTYSIDTVYVNEKDDFINLGYGMMNFSLSDDIRSLFYFDSKRILLQEIDLTKLELINNFQFERDGPNSIGFNPPKFQFLSNRRMLVSTHGFGVNIFGVNGQKQKSLKLNFREIEGLNYEEEGLITYKATLNKNESQLFALTKFDASASDFKLIVVELKEKTGRIISLPAMKNTLKSKINYTSKDSYKGISGQINLQIINDNLYVVSSVTSSVYKYDYEQNSLILHEFKHKLVPSNKTGEFKNFVSSEKEFYEEAGKLIYQINFEELIWDEKRNLFFRFASIPIPDQNKEWYDEAKIFLFAYDSKLNLLGEIYLPELKKVPDFPFFKDGKLWSCVNLDDKLGFAIFKLNF